MISPNHPSSAAAASPGVAPERSAAVGAAMPVVVVAGPTASGKSALALDLARAFRGSVINADSMQVYRDLHVLTARPSEADLAAAPHRLYGVFDGAETCSAGRWAELAAAEILLAHAGNRLPIVCGGTGLYLHALMDGLSPLPPVPGALRAEARRRLRAMGNAAFHARLAERDPETAARLAVGDSQRLVRAWEVLEATGRTLADWQREPRLRLLDARFLVFLLAPPRDVLYARCDARFDAMMEAGALDEVRALDARRLPPSAPVLKALGVPELRRALHGVIPLDEAVAQAKQATRRFAKRQGTWFRGQLCADVVLDTQYLESLRGRIFPIVRRFLLTEGG